MFDLNINIELTDSHSAATAAWDEATTVATSALQLTLALGRLVYLAAIFAYSNGKEFRSYHDDTLVPVAKHNWAIATDWVKWFKGLVAPSHQELDLANLAPNFNLLALPAATWGDEAKESIVSSEVLSNSTNATQSNSQVEPLILNDNTDDHDEVERVAEDTPSTRATGKPKTTRTRNQTPKSSTNTSKTLKTRSSKSTTA
jgi:hypothetical protein